MYNSHSNNPVPFFARGAGAERFETMATRPDEFAGGAHAFRRGPYFHQAEMGRLLMELVAPADPAATAQATGESGS